MEPSHSSADLAVALVNSYALDLTVRDPEFLRGPDDLREILMMNGLDWSGPIGDDEVAAARDLRRRLRPVFEAVTPADRVRMLNALTRGVTVRIDLDGDRVKAVLTAPTRTFAQWLTVQASIGLLAFLETHDFERLCVCQASPCLDVYADASYNHSRRFCSDRCANRVHSAAHRRRIGAADS